MVLDMLTVHELNIFIDFLMQSQYIRAGIVGVACGVLLGLSATTVRAEMTTPANATTIRPKITAIQNMRKEIQQERQTLMQENKEKRMQVIEENKEERQEFRKTTKEMLQNISPKERKEVLPTRVQERKNMVQENIQERTEVRKGIATSLQSFRASVQERWRTMFSSLFGKK